MSARILGVLALLAISGCSLELDRLRGRDADVTGDGGAVDDTGPLDAPALDAPALDAPALDAPALDTNPDRDAGAVTTEFAILMNAMGSESYSAMAVARDALGQACLARTDSTTNTTVGCVIRFDCNATYSHVRSSTSRGTHVALGHLDGDNTLDVVVGNATDIVAALGTGAVVGPYTHGLGDLAALGVAAIDEGARNVIALSRGTAGQWLRRTGSTFEVGDEIPAVSGSATLDGCVDEFSTYTQVVRLIDGSGSAPTVAMQRRESMGAFAPHLTPRRATGAVRLRCGSLGWLASGEGATVTLDTVFSDLVATGRPPADAILARIEGGAPNIVVYDPLMSTVTVYAVEGMALVERFVLRRLVSGAGSTLAAIDIDQDGHDEVLLSGGGRLYVLGLRELGCP